MITNMRFQGSWGISKDTGMVNVLNNNTEEKLTKSFGKFESDIKALPATMHLSYEYPGNSNDPHPPLYSHINSGRDFILISYHHQGKAGANKVDEQIVRQKGNDGWKFWKEEHPEKLIERAVKAAAFMVASHEAND